ncbi:MAG TPA: hypothetical protein PK052_05360 [Anaerohalosphaeraceae bacterium]|nr:hypothetical protein [Phycisphaerae bacterium]HOK94774.1 hypothetical protein [Anaerohalosphaeraceae bacterium]HOL31392.1 hypothetical protein [Anaerohalosphaeraceae bacterium]HOM76602.1 hypothetical protein [Anaerohalosphaeraceae bacterium]HPC64027.1 hypothetical protein [Anaerohalosphaeraceae bacterium]
MNAAENTLCAYANQCSFYQQSRTYMPAVSQPLRTEFCQTDNSRCACRQILSQLGIEWLPLHMMPYQYEWAQQILDDIANSNVPLEAALNPDTLQTF